MLKSSKMLKQFGRFQWENTSTFSKTQAGEFLSKLC